MKRLFTSRFFYKNLLTCILLTCISMRLDAQSVTNYTFAASTTTFTALTTPTTVNWVGNTDDAVSDLIPIGFDFWYMGTRYTEISASTNGWLTPGTTMSDYSYTNSLSTGGTPRPVIAPLWDDLDITANTNVTYKTTGTAGSRVFTIQYLNVKWYYLALGSVISFQAKLYESTGKIEFIYKPELISASSPSASIGITAAATGSGNFLSVNNAGTSVSSTNEANVTTRPTSGKRYAFTPPVPTAPGNLTFSAVGSTAMTLNWSDLSSNEIGFVIYRSTDGVNYSFVSQTAAGTTSSLESGLTMNTTYYWKVYAVSAGALSTALSGSQATTCQGPNISNIPLANLILNYKFNGNANDAAGNNNGTLQGSPAATSDRFGVAAAAYSFNGTSQYVSAANSYNNPGTYSMSVWFRTATTSGGLLIGFGSSQTGLSVNYDRNIYMNNAGQIYFGCNPTGSSTVTINSASSYNDNNWHLATATLSGAGMILYIDGAQVAINAGTTSSQNYTGYWRIGFDNVQWWPSAPASNYFNGTLDDALVYHSALTPAQVATLYNAPDGAGSNAPVCAGTSLNLTATTAAGSTYTWTGPNSFTSSVQNPSLSYTAAHAGVYQVQVTAAGCVTPSVAYVKVASSTTAGQWAGNVSSDWADANNWCDGVIPSSATDVTIAAGVSNMPVISSSVHCKNLIINTGATLTLGSAGTLNISGTLTNSGMFTNSGTVNFNGTSGQQTFSGVSSFYNVTLHNTGGLLLPAAITVNNNLTISAGTLNANNFNVAVKGNWTNNAATTGFAAGTATVTFNGTTAQAIGGSFATTFNNLTIADSGNVVTLNVNAAITGNLTVSSGTLDLAGFTANRATAGGILTVSNNATLKIGGTNTYPANYTTNTLVVASTVEYSGTNQTVANQTYGNLKLSSASGTAVKTFPGTALTIVGNLSSVQGTGTALSFTAAANITVSGNVSIGTATTFNGSSYAHGIGGNWVNNGTFNGNTGTVTFNGAGTSISGAGTQNFNNLTIAASSVGFSAGSITVAGNLATTGSGSFSQVSGGNLLMTGAAKTISGSGISLDNLTVSGSVSTVSLSLSGNLSVSGSFSSTGTLTMNGASKTISGAGAMSFAVLSATGSITTNAGFSITSGLAVNGSLSASAGTVTFTGTATISGAPNLFNINLNGTSLQLSANAILGIANAMTITSGTLNTTSSLPNTVNFNGTGAQNINALTYCNLVLSNGNTKTATGAITTNDDLTIETGTTLNPSSYTLSVYGDWINNGTFIPATSTVQFLGSATAYVTGATTFNILTSNTTSVSTQLFLNNDISASIVNMTNGIISTGIHTITITNTRTGPGFIYGNIQRSHTFNAGVAYAFEGPDNTITFTLPLFITSVTVSAVPGSISDFPFGGSISRAYNINIPAGTYVGAKLRLHYEDGELNGNNESSMQLWRYNGSIWVASGKTGNSTTSNYIEQSGLLNISGRWTCSDNTNVVRWNGSVSTDWNTAANWTVIQGSASAPPAATDIVNLGTVAFTHQPTISTAVNVKNIHFGSVQGVTLSMTNGGSLTSGDISGTWNSNTTHTINANNQSIIINGDLNLTDGTNGHAIDLNIGSGAVTITGSLLEDGGADITFNGNGTLNIAGDFHYNSGVFTPGNGTVIYNGTGGQYIAHASYNNLTLNNTGGIVVIDSVVSVAGNLLISSGELDNSSTIDIEGNVTISSGATLHNSYLMYVGGNWVNNGNYVSTGAQTIFNGTGTQTIAATTFNNLVINKPVGSIAELTGNLGINGDLTITSGTLDIKTFTCDRTVPGGTITIADSATFIVGGNNPPINFTGGSVANASTVIANGTSPQAIIGADYGHLILRNAGVKTLVTPITVNGNLTIENGATFNADSSTITLKGNWINSGTFIPSTGTVICAGAAKTLSGNTTFNHLTATGSYTFLSDMTFNGLLNITSTGSLSAGGTILTTMNGDLINSGVLFTLGTTTFTGNVVQTLSLINAVNTVALRVNFNGSVSPVLNSTSVPQFGYLTINNTGGVHPSVGWTILYSLTIGSGASFNGGASTHNILGAVTNNGTMSSSGILNFIPTSAVPVNLGSGFTSTGTVNFGGTGAITLAGTPVSFHDVVISNTNVAGISPSSGWNITNNFTVNNGAILNAGNHSWSIGGNISNSGTINSGASTFTLNGTGTQNIVTASAFNNLTISKNTGSTLLSSDVAVNGVLNFTAGKIQTGNNRLMQSSSGTITGAAQNTGWVNGRLQKNIITGTTSKTFEVGDAASYTPVSLVFSNVTTAGDLTVWTTAGDHPNIGSSTINTTETVNRFWTLQNTGIACTDYEATFHYLPTDLDPAANTNTFILGGYNGSSWTYPSVGILTGTSLQATGLTAFEDFQVGRMLIFSKTWDGGAGTHNWGDAANWNTNGVPTATDDVDLTGADTININVAATAKDLLMDNAALVLTTNSGNSLSISGNLTLTNGTFNTAAAFPVVSGTVNVAGGTVGFTGSIPQTIPAYNYHNLTSSSTGNRTLANNGIIGVTGTFTPGTNTYTVAGSTIDLNGGGAQPIPAFNYHNLTLSNAGVKTFDAGTAGIAGALSITGTAIAKATTNFATVNYNGSANQTIAAMTYYGLGISSTGGIVSVTNPVLTNFSMQSGTVDLNALTLTIPGTATCTGGIINNGAVTATGVKTMFAGTIFGGVVEATSDSLYLNGSVFNHAATFTKTGTDDIICSGGNVFQAATTITNSGTGFLRLGTTAADDFNSDVTFIQTGTGLLQPSYGANCTIAGNLSTAGSTTAITFGGTITLDGTGAQSISGPLSPVFNNLTISNTGNIVSPQVHSLVTGNLSVLSGTFDLDSFTVNRFTTGGILTLSDGAKLKIGGANTMPSGYTTHTISAGSTVEYNGANQSIAVLNSAQGYGHLTVSGPGTVIEDSITVSNNLSITAGSLNIGTYALRLGGSISSNGTFTANEGTVELNGAAAQTIPAATFAGNRVGNLTINNTAGVTLGGTLDLVGVLLSNGTFNTDGHLTLLSSDTQTALIDGSGTGEVYGNVTMQRYLPSGFGYKYLSSPFQAATVNEFSDEVDLDASFPAFYRYDESLASSGWVKYLNPADSLVPLQGYAALLGSDSAAKMIDITGVVNNNAIAASVLYNHNQPYTLGFNLVGNPYPSPIDWSIAEGWDRTNIDDAVYYFNAGTADQYSGTYSSYINGVSSDEHAGYVIPAMQGFFVHVSNGTYPVTGSLSVNNNARVNDLHPYFHKPEPTTAPLLRLNAGFADQSTTSDPVVVYFDHKAQSTFDKEMDALKLMNSDPMVPSLYVNAPGATTQSICAWPYLKDTTDVIPLGLRIKQSGWITFSSPVIERMPFGWNIYLYDAKNRSRHLLDEKMKYRLQLDAGDYENRFFLMFNGTRFPDVEGVFNAYAKDGKLQLLIEGIGNEKCDVSITNTLGQVILRKQFDSKGRYTIDSPFSSGVYIVSFYVKNHVFAQKIYIGN